MTASVHITITVVDFRRQGLWLEWDALGGTWTACDVPPPLVHGVALIRASQPNICLFGNGGALHLQVGTDRFVLSDRSPRIKFTRGLVTFGFRKRFSVESSDGVVLFDHWVWKGQGDDFFRWLSLHAADPEWRAECARSWSEGLDASVLRAI